MYRTFIRDWWIRNPAWPDGREPGPGPRYYGKPCADYDTIEEAREACQDYNDSHDPGPLSRKMEFEEV
jgi:hypothetical protein